MKWIRLLATGVVLVTVSLLLFAMGMMRGGSRWGWVIPRAFGVVGLAALLLGLAGVIVGGRRDGT